MSSPKPRVSRINGVVLAILVLVAIVIAFFWRMAFTNLILPRGDVFTYFYPYWAYRNAVLRSGHLPLWNPLLFMGAPFLANSQSGVLYPPNWLLTFFDSPTGVKVAILTHVIWAGTGTYLFARKTVKTSLLASLLAGICFALGGYLTAQVEHVNQLQGLSWLPWLFWLWMEAKHNKKAILWLGLSWAFQLLAGHTQSAFISGFGIAILVAINTASAMLPHTKKDLSSVVISIWQSLPRQQLVILAGAVALAFMLAAAQILPTIELTRLSNRSGGLPFLEAISFSLRPQLLGRALLPGYSGQSLSSEYVAYPGIVILILAFMGIRSQHHRERKYELIILGLAGIFLALGAYNPIYWVMVKVVPGFDLFRAPARWLVLWNFAAVLLAALGLDQITLQRNIDWRGLLVAIGFIGALALLTLLAPLAANEVPVATLPSLTEVAIWVLTALFAIVFITLSSKLKEGVSVSVIPALAVLAVIELFLAGRALPYNHLSAPEAWDSQRPSISTLLASEKNQIPPSRFLSMSDMRFDPGDLHELQAVYSPSLAEDDLYDFIIATKQQEIIAPNLSLAWGIPSIDGFDGGILPTRDYSQFTALLMGGTETPDGRLREHLVTVPSPYWLSIANVRYVITDKVFDAWIDGIYYDLQFKAFQHNDPAIPSPQPISAKLDQPFDATSLGIIGHLEDSSTTPEGTQIGTVSVYWQGMSASDLPIALPLLVGKDLAEGDSNSYASNERAIIGYFTPDDPTLGEYHATADWSTALPVDRVEISAVSSFHGTMVIRGMTLIDDRSQAFHPLALLRDVRTIQSGDVKIYEYRDSRPRAYLACNPILVQGQEEALKTLPQASVEYQVVIDDKPPHMIGNCDPDNSGTAKITTYEPESITVAIDGADSNTYLVLSDAWYPGWSATVDGQPVDILRANAIFRAVRLSPGARTVEFRYRSIPFIVGSIISIVSLLSVVAALFWWKPAHRDS